MTDPRVNGKTKLLWINPRFKTPRHNMPILFQDGNTGFIHLGMYCRTGYRNECAFYLIEGNEVVRHAANVTKWTALQGVIFDDDLRMEFDDGREES